MFFPYRNYLRLFFIIFLVVAFAGPGFARADTAASSPRFYLRKIEFQGLNIWRDQDLESVVSEVKLTEGETLPKPVFKHRVDKAVKNLQAEGLFSDIKAVRRGDELIFDVSEHPRVTSLKFQGNSELSDEKLKDVILLQRGDPASSYKLNRARRELSTFYVMRGYEGARVQVSTRETSSGRVVVKFLINEGKQKVITGVYFDFAEVDFLTRIHRKWGIGWELQLREGAPYSGQSIQSGQATVRNWYYTRGYMDVQVEPEAFHNKVAGGYDILYHVKEGPVYRLGEINLRGNSVYGDTLLRSKIPLAAGEIYNQEKMKQGLQEIEDYYQTHGYVEAKIFAPGRFEVNRDRDRQVVNVSVDIEEGQPYYVDRIEIHGNEKTYSRVIRRELRLREGDLLEGVKVRNSRRRLRNLGFFKSVEIDLVPGSKQNTKVIRVKVEEGRTGRLQFGGGYSSSSGFTGQLSVRKDNFSLYDYSRGFTGRGQSLELSANVGQKKDSYKISWDFPWINDDVDATDVPPPEVPISFGWSAFNRIYERDEGYDEIKRGGAIRLGREFGPALSNKVDLEYSFRSVEVDDLGDNWSDAPDDYKNEAQRDSSDTDGFEREIGSLELGLQRDRRDNRLFPTEGYFMRGSTEVAAEMFGGNTNYYQPKLDLRAYRSFVGPLFWALRFNYKTIDSWKDETDTPIPSFEKFYLGGHRSVRGYDYRDIAIYAEDGTEIGGGKTAFYTNLELRMMMIEDTMQMFLFGDLGDVYREPWKLTPAEGYASTGFGVRINAPIGPIILSWGKKLDNTTSTSDDKGDVRVEFTIGSGF